MVLASHPAAVATIPAHDLLIFLLQVALLLSFALVLGRSAARLGMPAVVGELFAGMVLGPSLLNVAAPGLADWLFPRQAAQFHLLDAVGQVGVLLLVGLSGSEVDMGMVRRRGATAARISAAGVAIPLGLGIGMGFLLPPELVGGSTRPSVFALFMGVAMCVSALPVIAKTLIDMNLLHRDVGQLTLAAGMVDDTIGWLMLSVVSAMATAGVQAGDVATSIGWIAAIIVFARTLGRLLVDTVLRLAQRSGETGVTAAAVVTMVLAAAAATQAMRLEAILGAFLCGILVGRSPALDRTRLAPLRSVTLGVLAPLFFATAGLRMDLTELGRPKVLLAAFCVLLIAVVGKFAGAYLGARTSGIDRWQALALGAAMNARGVIEVVVASVGVRLHVLNTSSYTIIVLVAIVTSLMAPPLLRLTMSRVTQTLEEEARLETTSKVSRAVPQLT
jgi:Kef-type K+ transport system membrane component KefB